MHIGGEAKRRTSIFISKSVYEEAQRRANHAGCPFSQVINSTLADKWLKDEYESDLKVVAAELRGTKNEVSHIKQEIQDLTHIVSGMVKLMSLLLPNLPEGDEIQKLLKDKANRRYGLFLLDVALNAASKSENNAISLLNKIRLARHNGASPKEICNIVPELRE